MSINTALTEVSLNSLVSQSFWKKNTFKHKNHINLTYYIYIYMSIIMY